MSDPTTQSNYDVIATTDVELDWHIDFDTQTISGCDTLIALPINTSDLRHVVLCLDRSRTPQRPSCVLPRFDEWG